MIVYGCDMDYTTCSPKNYHFMKGIIFLHGIAEDKNKFDQVDIDEPPINDGIYDCIIAYRNGSHVPGKCYFWHGKNNEIPFGRGLVVEETDEEAIIYANNCYLNRVDHI